MNQQGFTFQLTGFKELTDLLAKLPTESMQKAAVRNALKRAGKPIAEAAQDNARSLPVDAEKVAKSIKVSTSLKRSQRGRIDRSRVKVYIGARSPLAHLFEFGTSDRYSKEGYYRGMLQPLPFLRPAWDAGKGVALDILRKELWLEIQKAARRLRKKAEKGTLTAKQREGLLR